MNIFVSNLNFKVTSDTLKQHFEQYGSVTSSKIITDRQSGRSRGFGFVEMENDQQAEKAIYELNGTEFQGRSMDVKVANERPDNGNRADKKDRY